jgi:hypothetical protein
MSAGRSRIRIYPEILLFIGFSPCCRGISQIQYDFLCHMQGYGMNPKRLDPYRPDKGLPENCYPYSTVILQ